MATCLRSPAHINSLVYKPYAVYTKCTVKSLNPEVLIHRWMWSIELNNFGVAESLCCYLQASIAKYRTVNLPVLVQWEREASFPLPNK